MKTPTLILNIVLVTLAITPAMLAGESIPIDISKIQLGEQAELIKNEGQNIIHVEAKSANKIQDVQLFELDQPGIKQNTYALTGEVRYEKVDGKSYLEIWNHFVSDKDGKSVPSKYFTRGLNPTGPMGVLNTSSDWRVFRLPFLVNNDDATLTGPTKITLSIHLEGRGLVEIRNVKLVDGLETAGEAFRQQVLPSPTWIMLSALLLVGVPAAGITFFAIALRRRKRTSDELRRIQATDA